jgi:histidyl-tRNA synthetase
MKIKPVKGTRDFYPKQMAVRNWIIDGWKNASKRNGFEEYDGPVFEYLDIYRIKSGDEIVEQLFNFQDRGKRHLAIRPEITPTLARMVNQKINALSKPIKWFSVPRLCRAERPQKGRLREFFQWNIDIIGVDDVLADAEVIFCAVDYLRSIGFCEKDITVKISSRKMLAQILKQLGIPENSLEQVYSVLDKKAKLPENVFNEKLEKCINDSAVRSKVLELFEVRSLQQLGDFTGDCEQAKQAVDQLKRLFEILDNMGIQGFCEFDIGIVRGLAYYTGVVFEVYDKQTQLRAIGGGGRYDNLLSQFGGQAISATGFGMGDCVLEILLREKGILTEDLPTRSLDYFIACADDKYYDTAIRLAAELRKSGFAVDFSYKSSRLAKQFKQASAENARNTIIVGQELEKAKLAVKNMKTGEQNLVDKSEFLQEP